MPRVFVLDPILLSIAPAPHIHSTAIQEEFVSDMLAFIFSVAFVLSLATAENANPVTCNSAVTLQNKENSFYLHSHGIAWGSGSGQQSVTAHGKLTFSLWSTYFYYLICYLLISFADQVGASGNLWLVKTGFSSPECEVGQSIKCGERVRLEHVQTQKLLHSHLFKAPLSGNQEVSAFGEGGRGDTGDDWIVECVSGGEHWMRGAPVTLRHADTNKVLSTSRSVVFNTQNCGGGCPIMGQSEVSAAKTVDSKALWSTSQGVFFPPKDVKMARSDDDEGDGDEL